MDAVREIFYQVVNVIASLGHTIRVWDVIDILVIAFLIYRVLSIMHKTSASSIMKGLVIILAVAWIANVFAMHVITFLIRQVLQLGILVIVVLFQPEIRKLFERMGTTRIYYSFFSKRGKYDDLELVVKDIVEACEAMSKNQTGAIIVFERKVGLNDFADTGVSVNAEVSVELMQSIFFENSPMHDGALIIREGKILAAACMLPLSTNYNISKELGMRHRAGIGISERSDAVVVLVSEETGDISVAIDGMLKRGLDAETLEKLLVNEVLIYDDARERARREKIAKKVKAHEG